MTIEKSSHLAEVQLKYQCPQPMDSYPTITTPIDALTLLRSIWNEDHIQLKEEFVVLLLNTAKKCLGWSKISSGGSKATIVDPAAVYQVALLSNASSILLAHNHPSGNVKPSQADKTLTERIENAGEMLGIAVNDHVIITADGYSSFRARGLL